MATLRPPITSLSCTGNNLALASGASVAVFDPATGALVSRSHREGDVPQNKDPKSIVVRLVAVGQAAGSVAVVASVSEEKHLRMIRAQTGELLYERTLIKKASTLSVESDGTVIVADKVGDVFAYPFVDDAAADPSAIAKPRPEATALAVDPSLNPDADLLLGHVSLVNAHLLTSDGRSIITADRDEHIRVSRYPQSFVIERYLFGHTTFVSALCIPSTHPDILFSAGGDPHILIHQISTGNLLGRIAIAETVKPYRTVRASMRRVRKKGFKAEVNVPAGSTAQQTDQETQQRELPLPGQMPYTDEQWMSVPDGWGLPAGEGICITKMDNLGDSVVFFSEGCSAIHSFRIPDAPSSSSTAISTLPLPSPVLAFCRLPSPEATKHRILVSLDSAWKHRVDGGKSFIPEFANSITPRKLKGKQPKETEAKPVKTVLEDQDIIGIESQDDLRVVEVDQDGQMKDISSENASLLEALRAASQPVPAESALSVPLYFNLTVLPKWVGAEEEDAEGEAELGGNEGGSLAPQQLSNLGKRALGQLRAKGVDVDAELSQWKREQKKAARAAAKEKKRKLNTEAASSSAVHVAEEALEEQTNADADVH